jgi:hypothetical protein
MKIKKIQMKLPYDAVLSPGACVPWTLLPLTVPLNHSRIMSFHRV